MNFSGKWMELEMIILSEVFIEDISFFPLYVFGFFLKEQVPTGV